MAAKCSVVKKETRGVSFTGCEPPSLALALLTAPTRKPAFCLHARLASSWSLGLALPSGVLCHPDLSALVTLSQEGSSQAPVASSSVSDLHPQPRLSLVFPSPVLFPEVLFTAAWDAEPMGGVAVPCGNTDHIHRLGHLGLGVNALHLFPCFPCLLTSC